MLYTLAQAREAVKRFVDNGSCKTETIDARINEALERLTDREDFKCMQATVRIAVCDKSFTLPYNAEKLIYATIDGNPAKVFGTAYQFMSSGVGDMDMRLSGSGYKDIVDQGEFPFMFDIPRRYMYNNVEVDVSTTGLQLMAFSTEADDAGKLIRVRGFKSGKEIIGAGNASTGEDIVIHRWDAGIEGQLQGVWGIQLNPSTNYFLDISEVHKPVTKGYVSLFAVAGENTTPTAFFSFVAKYHPQETLPLFRRYAITNITTPACPSSVLALIRMRHVPLIDADDILPIDSLQALKFMVMAIREENVGNMQGAENFEAKAVRVMMTRERTRTLSDGLPIMLNCDYRASLGRHMNRKGLIL